MNCLLKSGWMNALKLAFCRIAFGFIFGLLFRRTVAIVLVFSSSVLANTASGSSENLAPTDSRISEILFSLKLSPFARGEEKKAFIQKIAELVVKQYAQEPLLSREQLATIQSKFLSLSQAELHFLKEEIFHEAAPEILRPLLKTKLEALPGFEGEMNWSAMFYLSKNALHNYYLGTQYAKLWLHRNSAGDDDRVFAITQYNSKLDGKAPRWRVFNFSVFLLQMNVLNEKFKKIEGEIEGRPYLIEASPRKKYSLNTIKNFIEKAQNKQQEINYSQVCKDGVVRALFAFSFEQTLGQNDLYSTLNGYWRNSNWQHAGNWENIENKEFTSGLKQEFLNWVSKSDYVHKASHSAGASAIFRMVDAGYVKVYQKKMPLSAGITKICGEPLRLEVVVLYPKKQAENDQSKRINVYHDELVSAILRKGNAEQIIFNDGSCASSQSVYGVYREWVEALIQGKDTSIHWYHSPENQWTGFIYPNGSFRWTAFDGLVEGLSYNEIHSLPHNEGLHSGRPVKIVTPGAMASIEQEEIWKNVEARMAPSQKPGLPGDIKVYVNGSKQAAEVF